MKLINLILILFISVYSFGQDINIAAQKSEFYKDDMIHTNLLFSESDEKGGSVIVRNTESVLTYNPYPKQYYIEHYDKNLNLVKKSTLSNSETSIIKGVIIKDNIVNFIQFDYDKKNNIITINILYSSIENLEFKKKELVKFKEEHFIKYFGENGSSYIKNEFKFISENPFGNLDFSKKKKFFTIRFSNNKKGNNSHYFLIFNNNFAKEYETKLENNYNYIDFKNIKISDVDGTIFLLNKVFENNSRKTKKKGITNYHYQLFKLSNNENQQIKLKEDTKFISSLYILLNNEDILLVGFYSEKDDNYLKGVCRYILTSNDLSLKNKSFNSLSEQFYTDKYSKGIQKNKKEIKHLEFRNILIDKQENIIINAEEFSIEDPNFNNKNILSNKQFANNNFVFSDKLIYHYDDIISVKINKKGEVLWSRNINKRQPGFYNSSFTATYFNNRVYFFINADLKELKNNRFGFLQTRSRKSNLFVISISIDDLVYKKLIDGKNSKAWYDVKNGIISDDFKSIIFQGGKNRNKQIIKFTIQ